MKRTKFLTLIIITAFAISCSDSSTSPGSTDLQGTLTMSVTDSYVDIESLIIQIGEIAIHKDSEWIVMDSVDHTIDLLDYNNGDVFELFSENLESGHYNQVRLMIDTAEITYQGSVYDLTIPGSWNTGLKLVNAFDISEGTETSLILDFDVSKLVHITNQHNSLTFVMKPTIRILEETETGRIRGEITNLDTTATAYAISGSDTVAVSPVKPSGIFVLAFLPAGDYSVHVEDVNGLIYDNSSVAVVNRQTTDLGQIEIQ
ncbi:DUF4382 domain-containing protein [candidate division KSB1 bacterium]